MAPRHEVEAVSGKGLKGDASYGRARRQVLLMEVEVLDAHDLRPGDLRENIVVTGIRLTELEAGDLLQVGQALLEASGPCDPCAFVDGIRPGLQDALKGERGVLARVVEGGTIRVDDPVLPADPQSG